MRTDICARDDDGTQTALLEALAAVGAEPDEDVVLDVPFSTGLHRFRAAGQDLTVFVDAWLVDLEGPDELVQQVVQLISTGDRG